MDKHGVCISHQCSQIGLEFENIGFTHEKSPGAERSEKTTGANVASDQSLGSC